MIMRGGIPKIQADSKEDCSNNLNMDVDIKFTSLIRKDENRGDKKEPVKAKVKEESRLSKARIKPMRKNTPQEDQNWAINYLTLIQNIQRKRRFTEISNELRQQSNSNYSKSLLSRQELNLKNSENSEKSEPFEMKNGMIGTETEISNTNVYTEYEMHNLVSHQSKKFKTWEMGVDPDLHQMVNMDKVRKERNMNKNHRNSLS